MAAYACDFVVSTILNGQPIREQRLGERRIVKVPFGSEYSLRLINRHLVRAKAQVSIDGTPVITGGGAFILGPNESMDIERFVDSLSDGKKFKFISLEQGMRTGEIQDPTNKKNGIIEVEFYKEIPRPKTDTSSWRGATVNCLFSGGSADFGVGAADETPVIGACYAAMGEEPKNFKSIGATVEGGDSNQKFVVGDNFDTEPYPVVIRIQLLGSALPEVKKTELLWGVFTQDRIELLARFKDIKDAECFLKAQRNPILMIKPIDA